MSVCRFTRCGPSLPILHRFLGLGFMLYSSWAFYIPSWTHTRVVMLSSQYGIPMSVAPKSQILTSFFVKRTQFCSCVDISFVVLYYFVIGILVNKPGASDGSGTSKLPGQIKVSLHQTRVPRYEFR
jgi:hypothetical protein